MKLKNLYKLYQISKQWEFVDDKLSIPDTDLGLLDIREGNITLEEHYNPKTPYIRGQFMADMTEEDYQKWQAQKSGWQKFYDKVLRK